MYVVRNARGPGHPDAQTVRQRSDLGSCLLELAADRIQVGVAAVAPTEAPKRILLAR
jgi:hypothetical protein